MIAVVASGAAALATARKRVVRFFSGLFNNSNVEKHSDKKVTVPNVTSLSVVCCLRFTQRHLAVVLDAMNDV
jgi:hypothetical protein